MGLRPLQAITPSDLAADMATHVFLDRLGMLFEEEAHLPVDVRTKSILTALGLFVHIAGHDLTSRSDIEMLDGAGQGVSSRVPRGARGTGEVYPPTHCRQRPCRTLHRTWLPARYPLESQPPLTALGSTG